jgi:hypothetical protein
VKVALPTPDATTTLAGAVSKPLLFASITVAALVAALFKVTVQVLEALLPNVEGAQASELSCAGATRLMVFVRFTPPALAVTTADWLAVTWAAVTVKLLEVCPAATVALEGSVRLALLLESETGNPPEGAVPFNETVQELVPGVLIVRGLQFKVLRATDTGRVMVPELPLDGMEVPPAFDATTPVSWMEIGLLEGWPEIWKVAVATGPSAITVLLNPTIRQLFPEQERSFPAAVGDVPGVTVTLVMSEEKLKVHWSPEVCAPPADVRLIGRTTVLPAVPVVDPSDRVTLWPKAMLCKPSRTKVLRRIFRATLVYRSVRDKRAVGLSPREYWECR